MTDQKRKLVQNAAMVLKNLNSIPTTKRTVDQQAEWSAALEVLREDGLDLFEELQKSYFDQLSFHFSVKDDKIEFEETISSYEKDLIEVEVPPIPQNLNETAIKQWLLHLAANQDRISAILQKLIPIQGVYDQVNQHATNVCKAVSGTDTEWEATALYALLLPDDYLKNSVRLNSLVTTAKIKYNRYQDMFKIVSRVITVETGTPGSDGVKPFSSPSWAGKPAWAGNATQK